MASRETSACLARVAPVCLSLCGEAVYSKSNNYGNNDQRIEDDLIANGKKAANDKAEAAKENKSGSKAEAKTLPNIAAVK
ncbi:hypothetical protein [Streptococcus vestibularis]|uniref:hypothetical protein n=1 Tax=Streptococcus vestibularis TaxID=1343 RepID=UPI0026EF726C|nr:hypothetical protein [Streptococcus vestibularis]